MSSQSNLYSTMHDRILFKIALVTTSLASTGCRETVAESPGLPEEDTAATGSTAEDTGTSSDTTWTGTATGTDTAGTGTATDTDTNSSTETTGTDTTTTTAAYCGDGVPEGDESCDDGDADNIDGCTEDCLIGPTGITLSGETVLIQYGDTSNGTAYDDACPAGEAVVGYHGYYDDYHKRIQAICGTLTLTNGSVPTVTVASGDTLPMRGTNGSTEWTRMCGTDQVVVGFKGRDGSLIDQLTFRCAPLEISQQNDSYEIAVGSTTDLAPVGGSGGSEFPQTDCPTGEVATVSNIRAGDSIDAFGLTCQTVGLDFP